jgi:hypothetical protein
VGSALLKSPAEQVTLVQRAVWGIVWWGVPFFGLYAIAFPLYAGEPITGMALATKFALCVFAGAASGLGFCTFLGRRLRSQEVAVGHALFKSPAEQVTLVQRAVWGIVWWGVPFFGLYAIAFPLYAGESITGVALAIKFVLCVFGGVVFGLGVCTFSGRRLL